MPPLTALTTALESTGISRHDAGPGLVTYLTSLLERPPNETARHVISVLQTILIPTFHLAPSAATDSGYDDPSATARVTVIANDLLHRGVVRAMAALALPTRDPTRTALQEGATAMLKHLATHRHTCPHAPSEPSLAASVSVAPLLMACLRLGVSGVSATWLSWFAGLVTSLHEVSRDDVAEGLQVPLGQVVDLLNLLLDALVERGRERVKMTSASGPEATLSECALFLPGR